MRDKVLNPLVEDDMASKVLKKFDCSEIIIKGDIKETLNGGSI